MQYYRIDKDGRYIEPVITEGFFREIPRIVTVTEKQMVMETAGDGMPIPVEKEIEAEKEVIDFVPYMPDDITDIPPPQPNWKPVFDRTRQLWIETGSPPEPDTEAVRGAKLAENSRLCRQILETEFRSAVKGDGLQPYRMNNDDQTNLSGMNTMINNMLFVMGVLPEDMPLFSWQNANQVKCVNDWHYTQIIKLLMEYGAWKTLILKRQDEIKERILNAVTAEELDAVKPDYGDLLVFGGDDA